MVGGPYAVNVGPRSATIMWVVESGQASVGLAPDKMSNIVPMLRAEKILLTGLKPGTDYFYQSFAGDAGKGSFKTAPVGASAFQFVVYGDTRTRHDVHRAVIQAILKYSHPDFAMQTGDLVENATTLPCGRSFSTPSAICSAEALTSQRWVIMNITRKTTTTSWTPSRITRLTGAARISP